MSSLVQLTTVHEGTNTLIVYHAIVVFVYCQGEMDCCWAQETLHACRPSSADSDAGSSPEGAGLFWRKHRLTAPQGLSLTLLDHSAITAGTSSTADQPDVDEEILLDTDNQSAATASPETGEGHAEASARGSRHEQQHSLHDPSREGSAMQSETQVGCSKQLQHRSNLPADREKLQQRMELPASCDAVQAQQPEVPMCANQLSGAAHTQQKLQPSDCQEQSESGHVAAITALQANTGAAIDLLHHLSPGQQPVSSMVQQQCDTEPVEHQLAAHAATQRQTDSATISGSNPAEETCSGGSSFLQRLAREKQMPPKSMQPFTNESATDRPPTPERPITPFSRPARRRNSGVMSQEGAMLTSVEPPRASTDNRSAHGSRAAGFADNNRIFAPMQDMDSTYMASISAKLAVRPASASAAQLPMAAGSPLSWTGSMQLPPGMLFGAAQQQHLLLKSKKRFNWGFDSPHRL